MTSLLRRAAKTYSEEGALEVLKRGFRKVVPQRPVIHQRFNTLRLDDQIELLDDLRQEDDWLLIVLDACRFDIFNYYFSDYFHGNVRAVNSVGRDTFEFISLCWPDEYDLTYISGIPTINSIVTHDFNDERWSRDIYDGYVPSQHFNSIIDVWDFEWEEDTYATPPEIVTDVAIDIEDSPKIVHYHQPHAPYIGDYTIDGYEEMPIPDLIDTFEISDNELRQMYRSNLERALSEVARLVHASSAETVVIIGDHGEALGEYDIYGHPRMPNPYTRSVPWATVTGVKSRHLTKSDKSYREGDIDGDVESKLDDLGYL